MQQLANFFRQRQQYAYYVFRPRNGSGLTQIDKLCGSLRNAKASIEEAIRVERYEEEEDQIYAIAGGQRAYRIHCRELRY